MSEQLVVRLGSESRQAIHWLVWSTVEREIIASGILACAEDLVELKSRAGGRPIITLIPSCDITFKDVELPGRSNKQLLNALPYMLEQELSSDIDKLHFSILDKLANTVSVAVIAHEKMQLWQSWLADAELVCEQYIPDALTLPYSDEHWSAVELDGQWLIRQTPTQGLCIESELLEFVLASTESSEEEDVSSAAAVMSYSAIDALGLDNWQQGHIELPMKLCAEGAIASRYNLLQGQYKVVREKNVALKLWRGSAIAACLAMVMIFANQFVTLNKLEQQQSALESEIKQVYKTVFKPKKMRLNTRLVKKQMQSRLNDLRGGGDNTGFLVMLSQLTPTFKQLSGIQPISVRFDTKQATLRLQVSATDFQVFDKLKSSLSTQFDVEQGTLSQQNGRVQGTLDIKGKR
ncbi:type II secretion system protein GspL [Moritella sp. Urea-trap-13]|uniref:type II secretion system protein GspL n=1 Tax=Moritella sp. Urea-trap-13 TaxID=2058327 RepID=UPI000C33D819|nr:type II secretion system protein GspL [Moritella sp. Urea-trap-13]PKH09109.1 type II secretion system protein GspL [Moritella sp. Urea-trap-13]